MAQKKNPAASAPIEAPAPFEASAQVENADPIADAAAFAEASAAEAPAPVAFETSAPVSAAVVESAAPATARVIPPEAGKMFEAPVKSMTEMQEKMRAMIEKGIAETRGAYTKAKSAADETNSALEASFVTAKTGAVEINAKVLEALRVSADANFDFVKSILGVKSIADYVTLAQRICAQADRDADRPNQGNRRARAEGRDRNGGAHKDARRQDLQDRVLTAPEQARRASPETPLRSRRRHVTTNSERVIPCA
jgi:hypothetical protein